MIMKVAIRKFTQVTGNTPLLYVQRARVEAAKRFLEKGRLTVEQVCVQVGYADFGFFRNIFKRLTGATPQDYKKRCMCSQDIFHAKSLSIRKAAKIS